MDIYGYPSYQYSQSDELAKQMFAQQALAGAAPFAGPEQSTSLMPMSSNVPWNSRGLPWGMQSPPQVVQFTGGPFKGGKFNPVMHCKRKSLDIDPGIPTKQLITEEKMAAHMNGLHISSQYTPHSLAAQDTDDMWMDTGVSMLNTNKLKGHTIVLSEELKKLKEEPILPAVLIERLEKPTMSLVVWKPRDNILEKIKEQDEKKEEEEEEEVEEVEFPQKRNGVLVEDMAINDVEM